MKNTLKTFFRPCMDTILYKFISAPLFLIILFIASSLSADDSKAKGLKAHTSDQLKAIEENSHWVVKVKKNKIGHRRSKEHLAKQGKTLKSEEVATSPHEEIVTTTGLTSEAAHQSTATLKSNSLPSAVNNSTLPSFPPIGNQGELGSCVAWGSTYYLASHEIGLLNGFNNKTGSQTILSPKWTYNLLNQGQDNGLWPTDAYQLLATNGAISIINFPYDSNYLAWDTNSQDWVSAISNRLAPVQTVAGLGGNQTQNLTNIKQLLNNGHILNFATYVDSWVYTTVKNNPGAPNHHVGEQAVSWLNGYDGGHYLTIVGYDDNVWIDINHNGKVDAGELGAFLIANSWGSNWGNDGFIWIAYDAFKAVSGVPHGPSKNRVPAGDAMNSMAFSSMPVAANYTPRLIGTFSITQAVRDQISVIAGVSTTAFTSATTTLTDYALSNQGGDYEFNGNPPGSPQTATFAIDMSDLLPSNSISTPMRYYLNIVDNATGDPTYLNSFTLLDTLHQQSVSCTQVPLVCDDSSVTAFIDYAYVEVNSQDVCAPEVNITSPVANATLSGTAAITVSATDDVRVTLVELYVDSQLYATDMTPPYYFSLDTTSLSNGQHTLSAIAYDTANHQTQNSITVNVANRRKHH